MTIKTFIIDDEAPARRELRYLLEQAGGVEVVGEAANGTEALKGIRSTRPRLVFVDVEMPGLSGLELAQFLSELPEKPLIVFATAFEQFAVQAFEVEAFDYLLKPFSPDRVSKTVAKAAKFLAATAASPRPEAGMSGEINRKIPLYRGEVIVPTAPERVLYFRCEGGDVFVHACDGRYRARFTLNELEQRLAAAGFVRTHRSFLVNTDHVREVVPWFHGSYKLVMDDRERTEIPVSRYNVKEIKKYFAL
jgi:DNA-binding LytR/AlgR family response regulator